MCRVITHPSTRDHAQMSPGHQDGGEPGESVGDNIPPGPCTKAGARGVGQLPVMKRLFKEQ